jgi:hypothetical protein
MQTIELEAERLRSLRALASGALRLKWLAAARRFEIAAHRHRLALKYGYNPAQPRVPRGNPDGGQWTDAGGGSQGNRNGSLSGLIHLAGEIPTGDSPEIPKEPPKTTRLRNVLVRSIARRLGPYIWIAAEAGSWVYDHKEEINSYFDPPKSLDDLREAAKDPKKGYDIHHIVERNSAAGDGSEADLINAPGNKVAIPRWKHWQINSYYLTPNKDLGGLTPRQYLRGKSWEERARVGLEALRKAGVL